VTRKAEHTTQDSGDESHMVMCIAHDTVIELLTLTCASHEGWIFGS
jgi:hypothetical protein